MSLLSVVLNYRKQGLILTLFVALAAAFASCKSEENPTITTPTITATISANSKFTLLKAALVRAGLDGTLDQAGNYTLLAPTDDAFKAIGYGDVAVINLAPVSLLQSVLQYHVINSVIPSTSIATGVNTPVATVAPNMSVYFTKTSSTSISVNGARIIQADGQASNGVIHAIDRILLPPVFGNVVATIQGIPTILPTAPITFNLLQAAIAKVGTGVSGALTAAGPLTVFAPTDAAFAASGFKDVAAINAASVAALTSILSYHVVNNSRTYTPQVTSGQSLTTLQTGTVTLGTSTTGVTVTGKGNGGTASNLTFPDITATNGVVHIIDRLLLPQ